MVKILTDKNFKNGGGINLSLDAEYRNGIYFVSSASFVGDLTGDGKTEISASSFTGNVTILYGNSSIYGDVTFTEDNSQYFCCYSGAVGVQDITGDKIDDLLFESYSRGEVYLLPGAKNKLNPSKVQYIGTYTSLDNPVISIGDVVGDPAMDLWWPYSETDDPNATKTYFIIPGGAYLLDNFEINQQNVLSKGGWVIQSKLYLTPYTIGDLGFGIKDELLISGYNSQVYFPNAIQSYHIIKGGQNLTKPINLEDLDYEYLLYTSQIVPNNGVGLRDFVASNLNNFNGTFKGFGISFFNYTTGDPDWNSFSNYCVIDGRNLSLSFKPDINNFINCEFGSSITCIACDFVNIGYFNNANALSIFETSPFTILPVGITLPSAFDNLNVPCVLEHTGFVVTN